MPEIAIFFLKKLPENWQFFSKKLPLKKKNSPSQWSAVKNIKIAKNCTKNLKNCQKMPKIAKKIAIFLKTAENR